MCALIDPGDGVIFADPAYPAYDSCSRYLQAEVTPIPLVEAADFRLDLDRLAATMSGRTKLLILNSPHNPTGGVLTRGDLETIADLATRHDVTVVSDEIYSRNLYAGRGYMRFSYVNSLDAIALAVERLRDALPRFERAG